jgi:hypothetical protein
MIFCINLLPVQVVHDGGKLSSLAHRLPSLSLKELKSELSGLGKSQTFQSLDRLLNSSKVFLLIFNSLLLHSSLLLNFNSHQYTVHLNVHFAISTLLIFTFIRQYQLPGSSLSHIGSQISDQFSNFHGQSFSISCLNFAGRYSSLATLFSSSFLSFFLLCSLFFACQKFSSIFFCSSALNSVIGVLLFITKNK